MENTDIQDAIKLQELINSGCLDRVLSKVQRKLSENLFKTEHKEVKKREDLYSTSIALKLVKDNVLAIVNEYTDYKTKAGK